MYYSLYHRRTNVRAPHHSSASGRRTASKTSLVPSPSLTCYLCVNDLHFLNDNGVNRNILMAIAAAGGDGTDLV